MAVGCGATELLPTRVNALDVTAGLPRPWHNGEGQARCGAKAPPCDNGCLQKEGNQQHTLIEMHGLHCQFALCGGVRPFLRPLSSALALAFCSLHFACDGEVQTDVGHCWHGLRGDVVLTHDDAADSAVIGEPGVLAVRV